MPVIALVAAAVLLVSIVVVDGVRAGRTLLRDGAVITLAQVLSFTFHANHRNQP